MGATYYGGNRRPLFVIRHSSFVLYVAYFGCSTPSSIFMMT